MRKFEAHITCPRNEGTKVSWYGEIFGWKFSAIDGDPVMGKQAYCYLTGFDTDGQRLLTRMQGVCEALRQARVEILREKVEEIIYDTKTGVDCLTQCCGHCGEP